MQRQLGRFSSLEFIGGPVASFRDAVNSQFIRSVDEYHQVTVCRPARFQQQSSIKNDGIHIVWCLCTLSLNFTANARSHDAIELFECHSMSSCVTEYTVSQSRTADLPVVLQNLISKLLHQLLPDLIDLQLPMTNLVGINDQESEI